MKCVLLLLSLLLLVGCDGDQDNQIKTYETNLDDLDYSITLTNQLHWPEVLSLELPHYLVYFYSESCGYCKSIKGEVLSYYLKTSEDIYFVNVLNEEPVYKSNDGQLIGVNQIDDFYILGTPFLVEIENNTVSNWYAGVEPIRFYIESKSK